MDRLQSLYSQGGQRKTKQNNPKPRYLAFKFIHEYKMIGNRSQRQLSIGPASRQGFRQNHLRWDFLTFLWHKYFCSDPLSRWLIHYNSKEENEELSFMLFVARIDLIFIIVSSRGLFWLCVEQYFYCWTVLIYKGLFCFSDYSASEAAGGAQGTGRRPSWGSWSQTTKGIYKGLYSVIDGVMPSI